MSNSFSGGNTNRVFSPDGLPFPVTISQSLTTNSYRRVAGLSLSKKLLWEPHADRYWVPFSNIWSTFPTPFSDENWSEPLIHDRKARMLHLTVKPIEPLSSPSDGPKQALRATTSLLMLLQARLKWVRGSRQVSAQTHALNISATTVWATTCLGVLLRIRHGGTAHHEGGVGAVHLAAYPPQPPQDERRVAAEHAAVGVGLVNDNVPAD